MGVNCFRGIVSHSPSEIVMPRPLVKEGEAMGYFSNGAEGMNYGAQYCDQCIHQEQEPHGCPIWMLHMQYNYDECNKPDSWLHVFIPRTPDGLGNEQCKMFTIEVTPEAIHTFPEGKQ